MTLFKFNARCKFFGQEISNGSRRVLFPADRALVQLSPAVIADDMAGAALNDPACHEVEAAKALQLVSQQVLQHFGVNGVGRCASLNNCCFRALA